MPPRGVSPFQMLLCERGPTHAHQWAEGFAAAQAWMAANPADRRDRLYAAMAAAGDWSAAAGLPYDAWHEGLAHGVYGLVALADEEMRR